ncbi:rRNA N6-adenosine-methyltransferase METTL5-like isoform X2 [Pyrus x bretschneideri]|uniref:rRNA N6-adenosine-methyltransferase METTL5-like isoform X2 n=1 Tax=Pyrus x bretschneideri TaxID=225117 RepID=UPI00202DE572|nr:rRNA N6-adenosine-methyltransferase METTL5-like isoform X2 [Pyrus x bretschneideri]
MDLELDVEFIQCNIKNLGWRADLVDTVVMNPPFGTRKKGADMDFLSVALKIATQAVYSLHKTSTRDVSHTPCALTTCEKGSSAELQC